jgi:hypothetical protein
LSISTFDSAFWGTINTFQASPLNVEPYICTLHVFLAGILIIVGIAANKTVFCEMRAIVAGTKGTGFCTTTGD